jgi:hypothetical protein
LRTLAESGENFTADDLLERVGHPDDAHGANGRNNAVGSLFRSARAEGLIESTGTIVKSRQPERKGGMVQVWRGAAEPRLFS